MFCEGTRFTVEKHAKSVEYAREKGYRELKHHLVPRVKGFSILAQQLKTNCEGGRGGDDACRLIVVEGLFCWRSHNSSPEGAYEAYTCTVLLPLTIDVLSELGCKGHCKM